MIAQLRNLRYNDSTGMFWNSSFKPSFELSSDLIGAGLRYQLTDSDYEVSAQITSRYSAIVNDANTGQLNGFAVGVGLGVPVIGTSMSPAKFTHMINPLLRSIGEGAGYVASAIFNHGS